MAVDVRGMLHRDATLLYFAAGYPDNRTLEYLFDNNHVLYINSTTHKGYTALHIAALRGVTHNVFFLLSKNADLAIAGSPYHATALHVAAISGYVEVASILIDHGSDMQAKDMNSLIPEFVAYKNSHVDTAALLKERALEKSTSRVDQFSQSCSYATCTSHEL